jgi:hypothetical protein
MNPRAFLSFALNDSMNNNALALDDESKARAFTTLIEGEIIALTYRVLSPAIKVL